MKRKMEIAIQKLNQSGRVLVLTGAGISAESGVPTFRGGGGTSVWRGMPFEQLSSKQMVDSNLPLVWEWFDYRRSVVSECQPNAAHQALAAFEWNNRFEDFKLVTQNVDGLHAAAGSTGVIELHGSIWRARCLKCEARRDMRTVPAGERPPLCLKCGNVMRPDVVLFGENLPSDAFEDAELHAKDCDVCIVVGTSALVQPAALLPEFARAAGAFVIEVNPEETVFSGKCDLSLRGRAGEILPQILPSDDRELVLSIGWEGGCETIYRRPAAAGSWQYSVDGNEMWIEDDENENHSWKQEASSTLEQAIESLGLGHRLVRFHPIKVHPEYRQTIWEYVNRIAENPPKDFKDRFSINWEHRLDEWRRMTIDAEAEHS